MLHTPAAPRLDGLNHAPRPRRLSTRPSPRCRRLTDLPPLPAKTAREVGPCWTFAPLRDPWHSWVFVLLPVCVLTSRQSEGEPMALLTCPDCRGPVSDQAVACPKCGRPVETAPPPPATHTPTPAPATETVKQDRTGQWIGCGLLIVFALVAVWLVSRDGGGSGQPRRATQYKINTPQGQADMKECLWEAAQLVEPMDDGKAFVPLSAIKGLRECGKRKGFTEKGIQIMVDSLTGQ